jgi:hypothetical protein
MLCLNIVTLNTEEDQQMPIAQRFEVIDSTHLEFTNSLTDTSPDNSLI